MSDVTLFAPTAVTPASGSTVTVPNPELGATITAGSPAVLQRLEWNVSSTSNFTGGTQFMLEEAVNDLEYSGPSDEIFSFDDLWLSNGTWYIRARSLSSDGQTGPWSSGHSFTVNVPVLPTPTGLSPTNGSSVTIPSPALSGTVVTDSAQGRQQTIQWQAATDVGFTANVKTQLGATYKSSGAVTSQLSDSLRYDQGTTWYFRMRSYGTDRTYSAWSATNTVTLNLPAPPTPTNVVPANGATVTTSRPTLGATVSGSPAGVRSVYAQWDISTTSDFSANVKTVTEANTAAEWKYSSTATTEVVPLASALSQATWYIRARSITIDGQPSAWTATTSFTVSHPPAAVVVSPAAGQNLAYAATTFFNWDFSDTYADDTQSAYQIIIERQDTGAVVVDTGKVTSTSTEANIAISDTLKKISLRWKIRVWDAGDVVGPYSAYRSFTVSDAPVVTITSPTASQVIDNGQPTITWTVDVNTTQKARRVLFTKASDGSVVYDSETTNTSQLSYGPPFVILQNNTNYNVTVYVTSTLDIVGSSVRAFSTSYQAPPDVTYTVDADTYDTLGYVDIDWSTMTADSAFIDWRVYRRLSTSTSWERLATIVSGGITSYKDWEAGSGNTYEYAVTQTAGRSGTIIESALPANPTDYLVVGTHYWILNPYDDTMNLRLSQVVDDSYTEEYEQADYVVLGRGRKVNYGTRIGHTGTLSAQLRDDAISTARQKKLQLELIKAARGTYQLRTPFGDVYQVALGNIGVSRIAGVSTAEYCDVTVPYMEVM